MNYNFKILYYAQALREGFYIYITTTLYRLNYKLQSAHPYRSTIYTPLHIKLTAHTHMH